MKAALHLPVTGPHLEGGELTLSRVARLARAAEDAGFDAVHVSEHPVPPSRPERGGHHTPDPVVLLTAVAALTTSLRLLTHVLVLPYRNPFLAAKAAATLDQLSGGRLILGVAAGYLQPEFEALGVPFDERNERLDESIDVLRAIWRGEAITWNGRHFRADDVQALPPPVQQPHLPIWVGGNSKRAVRRSVERGDGWVPFPNPAGREQLIRTPTFLDIDDFRRGIDIARAHAAEIGRSGPFDVAYMPLGREMYGRIAEPDRILESAQQLAGAGMTYALLTIPARDDGAFFECLESYARDLLPALSTIEPGRPLG